MSLFFDTGVLIGLVMKEDENHDRASAIVKETVSGRHGGLATSDYVLTEALNYVSMKGARARAAEEIISVVLGTAEHPPLVNRLVRVHAGHFAVAISLFREHLAGRRLSLTDCTTLAVMGSERIKRLATFDSGFQGLVPEMVS